jgi:hypothetical protein
MATAERKTILLMATRKAMLHCVAAIVTVGALQGAKLWHRMLIAFIHANAALKSFKGTG